MRLCLFCGNEFTGGKKTKRYCSPECGVAGTAYSARGVYACDITYCKNSNCGKPFGLRQSKNGKPRLYCSRSCSASVNNRLYPKRELLDFFCVKCGTKLHRENYLDRRIKCEDCLVSSSQDLILQPSYSLTCKRCLEVFSSLTNTRSYCSKECRYNRPYRNQIDWGAITVREARGDGNANYKSLMPYLRQLSRKIYLNSDKPKECLVCGYNKHFDVAHVKDMKDFADDDLVSDVNDLNNLIALCKNHHWEFDKDHLPIEINGQMIQK